MDFEVIERKKSVLAGNGRGAELRRRIFHRSRRRGLPRCGSFDKELLSRREFNIRKVRVIGKNNTSLVGQKAFGPDFALGLQKGDFYGKTHDKSV